MMRVLTVAGLFAVLVLLVAGSPAAAQTAPSSVTMMGNTPPPPSEKIEEAVANACETLKDLQQNDGSWADYPGFAGATTALVVQALALAGEPLDSPCMVKAMHALEEYNIQQTYSRACRAMAYAQLIQQYPKLRSKLASDAAWLVSTQQADGMWSYPTVGGTKIAVNDNSNTQFAVLGLRAAASCNIEIPNSTWAAIRSHYTSTITPDGGWGYYAYNPEKFKERADKTKTPPAPTELEQSMLTVTAPSVASLMIADDELLRAAGCPCNGDVSSGAKIDDACVEKGLQWLIDVFEGKKSGGSSSQWLTYYYYGLLRAGQASGLKTFGSHDWYQKGAAAMFALVGQPCAHLAKIGVEVDKDGKAIPPKKPDKPEKPVRNAAPPEKPLQGIPLMVGDQEKMFIADSHQIVDCSLGIIFLVKGSAPVLMNKLKYEGNWNRHRRDLAVLAEEASKRLERPFRWQVVELRGKVETWHDSPLLYLSGEDSLKFSADEKKKIQEFCFKGGTLLLAANCGNQKFATQARALVAELWPQFPLTKLPADHPVYNCQIPVDAPGTFEGVNDGIRTQVFFTEKDLSCAWQTHDVAKNKAYFDLAINLYAYATDKAPRPPKLGEIEGRIQARLEADVAWQKALADEKEAAAKEKRAARDIPKPSVVAAKKPDINVRNIRAGGKTLVTMSLLKHAGDYNLGLHYQSLQNLVADFQEKAGVTLALGGAMAPGEVMPGVPDVLVVRGDKALGLSDADKTTLSAYLTGGGYIVAEAIMGSKEFDDDFRKFIADSKVLKLELLAPDDPLLKGNLPKGMVGLEVSKPNFSRVTREEQPGLKSPPVLAIKAGNKIVGYYSPLDLTYSATGNGAYNLRGYDKATALELLVNMLLPPTIK